MPQTVSRDLLFAHILCSLFFALSFAIASVEVARGARSFYFALMTLTAASALTMLLLRKERPRLAAAFGGLPPAALTALILTPLAQGLLSR